MNVDNYKVESRAIQDVIDKLAEADGSPIRDSRIAYLAEAASLLAFAVAEEAEDVL